LSITRIGNFTTNLAQFSLAYSQIDLFCVRPRTHFPKATQGDMAIQNSAAQTPDIPHETALCNDSTPSLGADYLHLIDPCIANKRPFSRDAPAERGPRFIPNAGCNKLSADDLARPLAVTKYVGPRETNWFPQWISHKEHKKHEDKRL
jgi:hypothetical protein